MISFAQNHEDVVLARAFSKTNGFYIDVGAAGPTFHSVTKHFYDIGWRGINVEPIEFWHADLLRQRPRDTNLMLALSDREETKPFFDVSEDAAGESSLSPAVGGLLRKRGYEPRVRCVATTTLAEVCNQHCVGQIDFLKVDVEGAELDVLQGGDWQRFRPLVALIETIEPITRRRVDDPITRFMSAIDYRATLFDGINTFYVRDESFAALAPALSTPVNATDDFLDHQLAEAQAALAGERRLAREARVRAATADERSALAADRCKALEHRVSHLQAEVTRLEERVRWAQADVERARRDAKDAEIQFRVAREALERLGSTDPPPLSGPRG